MTPQAHGVNLNVDMDDDEDADPANYQGDPDNPGDGDVIVEQNEGLLEQGDDLTAQEPLPSSPTAERRYPARERHPPERFST